MLNQLPPPVFKYDVSNLKELENKIKKWKDYDDIPQLELKEIIVDQDAILKIPSALTDLQVKHGSTVVVVMDETPMIRDKKSLKPMISEILSKEGYIIKPVVLKGDEYGLVHADFHQVETVLEYLKEDSVVVSVGAGVITDITKHACFVFSEQNDKNIELPLITYMTACSVPAYTSKSSIISKDGVKRTWPSRTPDIIIMDIQTLIDCPSQFTIGGVGDTLPVFVAFADWYFADSIGMGNVVDAAWRIDDDIRDLLLPYIEEIADRTSIGMEVLGKCIHNVGLSMAYANDSVPASGFEHVIGHMLDMSASFDNRKLGIHGQQIGVASLLTLIHIEKLMDHIDKIFSGEIAFDIKTCYPDIKEMEKLVLDTFHPIDNTSAMGKECWNDFSIKLNGWYKSQENFEDFIKNWPSYKSILLTLMPYDAYECAKALQKLGHPLSFEELDPPISRSRGCWAMKNANLMRKRFSSADLAFFLGCVDDDWVEDVFVQLEDVVKRL